MRLNKLQFMYILGDIGNSETKIFLIYPNGKVFKRINFLSKDINKKNLNIKLKKIEKYFNKIEKILFCSVVPKKFIFIKEYF